jgi:hypothetical protein
MFYRLNNEELSMLVQRRLNMKPISYVCLVMVISCGFAKMAAAQHEAESPAEQQKLKIAQAFCGTDGKIAECVGYPARDCAELVKPLVKTCAAKPASRKFSTEDAFERCFWNEYMKKYGKQIDRSERCIKTDPGKSPLDSIPSNLEHRYKLVNTPKPEGESNKESTIALFPENVEPGM